MAQNMDKSMQKFAVCLRQRPVKPFFTRANKRTTLKLLMERAADKQLTVCFRQRKKRDSVTSISTGRSSTRSMQLLAVPGSAYASKQQEEETEIETYEEENYEDEDDEDDTIVGDGLGVLTDIIDFFSQF